LADGGLGSKELIGRPRKAVLAGYRQEDFQLRQLHSRFPKYLSAVY
jgi:hypothetical protein